MNKQAVIDDFYSELTMQEIFAKHSTSHKTVVPLWKKEFGEQAFTERKTKFYSSSKLGNKNPMTGKNGVAHPNWKTDLSRDNGYIRVHAPEWYKGSKNDGYARLHILAYCENNGLDYIPDGMDIHHLDMNKDNNDISNLICLSTADHTKLHAWIKRFSKEQRLDQKVVGRMEVGRSAQHPEMDDDIVRPFAKAKEAKEGRNINDNSKTCLANISASLKRDVVAG